MPLDLAHCLSMDDAPKLLKLSDTPVLSQAKAREHSEMLARVCGFDPKSLQFRQEMILANGRKTTPKEDIETIRKTGAGADMQSIYDARNSLLKLSIVPIGFSIHGATGMKMTVSSQSPVVSKGSPSRSMAQYHPLIQLIDDVLQMRRMCVDHSSMALHCLPFYRSYLSLCIAVVDCFVNYCSKYLRDADEFMPSDYVNELLALGTSQERKLEILWDVIFLNHNKEKDEYHTVIFILPTEDAVLPALKSEFIKLKHTPAWGNYIELKGKRNKIVHPSNHIDSIYIEDIAADLNKCRGIGEVLLNFTRHQNFYAELGGLRQLAYAPLVEFT